MAQFDVYRNGNAASRSRIPYLLDIQSDLLGPLVTRVVIPMARTELLRNKLAERLNPVFEVEGRNVFLLTPELAGVPTKALGEKIGNFAGRRNDILTALDLLFTGI